MLPPIQILAFKAGRDIIGRVTQAEAMPGESVKYKVVLPISIHVYPATDNTVGILTSPLFLLADKPQEYIIVDSADPY